MATSSEFKKHKDVRKVTFTKDHVGQSGKVRYKKGQVRYMDKSVAKKVVGSAKVEEVDWKKLYAETKKTLKAAEKKAKEAAE